MPLKNFKKIYGKEDKNIYVNVNYFFLWDEKIELNLGSGWNYQIENIRWNIIPYSEYKERNNLYRILHTINIGILEAILLKKSGIFFSICSEVSFAVFTEGGGGVVKRRLLTNYTGIDMSTLLSPPNHCSSPPRISSKNKMHGLYTTKRALSCFCLTLKSVKYLSDVWVSVFRYRSLMRIHHYLHWTSMEYRIQYRCRTSIKWVR